MRDLGHLNRQLLSFNNAAVEEDQAQADDQASASGPVASASASDQIVQLEAEHPESHGEPGFSSACDRKPGLGQESRGSGVWGLKKVYSFPSFTRLQAAIQGPTQTVESDEVPPDEALGQVAAEEPATTESGEVPEPALNLEQTMEALKAQAAEGDKDEMLGRLFGLLETQKVQQQALLSRLQSRQEMDERKNVILTALYNRDMQRLRAELQALTVSDLVSIRDEALSVDTTSSYGRLARLPARFSSSLRVAVAKYA